MACLFTFDDGYASVYTIAFPALAAAGGVGTVYVWGDRIGDSGMLTAAQLAELQAAGWAIGNHTDAHVDATGKSQAEMETAIGDCEAILAALDLTVGAGHYSTPYGTYNAASDAALAALGFATCRCGMDGNVSSSTRFYRLPIAYLSAGDGLTLAQAEGRVDTSKATGVDVMFTMHRFVAADPIPIEWTIADTQELIAYCGAQGVDMPNVADWYDSVLGTGASGYVRGGYYFPTIETNGAIVTYNTGTHRYLMPRT